MTRLLRSSDIRAAVTWFCDTDPLAPHRTKRVIAARRLFYATLRELGWSWRDIADAASSGSGCPHVSGVKRATERDDIAPEWVAMVVERAEKMVEAENE